MPLWTIIWYIIGLLILLYALCLSHIFFEAVEQQNVLIPEWQSMRLKTPRHNKQLLTQTRVNTSHAIVCVFLKGVPSPQVLDPRSFAVRATRQRMLALYHPTEKTAISATSHPHTIFQSWNCAKDCLVLSCGSLWRNNTLLWNTAKKLSWTIDYLHFTIVKGWGTLQGACTPEN